MSPESRRWKRAYEENVELPNIVPRIELTKKQKSWLERAWTHSFGFVPNAVPIYNEKEGFAHRPGVHIHWHHIEPIGEVTRLHGESHHEYNQPRNIVPVCSSNHTGAYSMEDEFIIHPDVKVARDKYPFDHSSFEHMAESRRLATASGQKYHDTEYDMYFLELADRVVSQYELECPEDMWPNGRE